MNSPLYACRRRKITDKSRQRHRKQQQQEHSKINTKQKIV